MTSPSRATSGADPGQPDCSRADASQADPRRADHNERDPWERYGWLMSTIWLIFLLFPIVSALNAPTAWVWRIVAVAGILAFGAVYTLAFIRLGRTGSLREHRVLGVSRFAILVALTLALIPVLTWNALGMTPFLVSFASFFFTRRTGVVIIAIALVLAGAGIWLAGPELYIFPGIILLVGVSTQLVATLDRRQHEQRELRTQMSLTNERDRVARDVHDVLGHSLTVITVKAELAERLLDLDPERARAELAEIRTLSRQALAEVRATVGGLRAARLDQELQTADTVLRDAGIESRIDGDVSTVDPSHRTVLAWVLREAVTNVVRHSRATTCTVLLESDSLSVTDDGRGLNGDRPGHGIQGLNERVEAAGGHLELGEGPNGTGTRLRVQL